VAGEVPVRRDSDENEVLMPSPLHDDGGADERGGTTGDVLVINAGSSSLKFALVDPATGDRHLFGMADRLGTDQAVITVTSHGVPDVRSALPDGSHDSAVSTVLAAAQRLPVDRRPIGVGHRVVHGGELFADSVLITEEVLDAISRFSALAPLHNPPALLGIRAVSAQWPGLPQSAVFDTAFHQTMPPRAYRYAVPEEWYAELGVRRYGFHGTSHRYVSERAAELLGRSPDELALVVAHLGNGCSATAVLHGRSVDTTMGLTPLEGLVMGTRSGDVDPGLFGFLAQQRSLSSVDVLDALNKRSGLLALSGRTNDMRQIQSLAAEGDEHAQLALDVFVYRMAKAVSALVVGLGRLDALVFTGGIGENDARVRARVVEALGFLGLQLDAEANAKHGEQTSGRIAREGPSTALVVPTDEELMIARDTTRLIAAR
jgi:acetate kinase